MARKPHGLPWQSWEDRQIQEAQARGVFDNLPGLGKPLKGLDEPYDENWWIRKKLVAEGVSMLPPSLAIRKKIEIVSEQVMSAMTEQRVRDLVSRLNDEIVLVNRTSISGPPTSVMPLDVEKVVQQWSQARDPCDKEHDDRQLPFADSPDGAIEHGEKKSGALGRRRRRWRLRPRRT